ncbi:MAG: hypothetical protein E7665_08410 [Ruminococcaceae bacterium]|nr:hypothetical protein [Oscillospiraceae bacterium]
MKRFIIATLIVSILIASMSLSIAADKPYTEFFPAKDLKISGGAISQVEAEGAIHDKVLTPTVRLEEADKTKGFALTFTVPADGKYVVWGRIFYPTYQNNSMVYSVDGGKSFIWDFPDEDPEVPCNANWHYFFLTDRVKGEYSDTKKYGPWTIENGDFRHYPNVLELKKGEHTIYFSGREQGWYVDEFVVTSLGIDEYDPNACEGNDKIFDCKFCGTEHEHYYQDSYATKKITAEEYYNTVLYPEKEEIENKEDTAPTTGDVSGLIALAALVSAAGAALMFNKKRV